MARRLLLFLLLFTSQAPLHAMELTGRLSMLGATSQAEKGDVGYTGDEQLLLADQQSLRLMLDHSEQDAAWRLHVKAARLHLDGYPAAFATSRLFRYDDLANAWLSEADQRSSTRIGHEIDRAVYERRFAHGAISIGRQAIDWGSGRLWQPLNLFGAFSPTDLDTDFKPGIDAVSGVWYPTHFSSFTVTHVWAPEDEAELENSAAVHYRSRIGAASEYSLVAGSVLGKRVAGGSFESVLGGMGWRIEGVRYEFDDRNGDAFYWIAGVDYQFDSGLLLVAEWYDNSRGADTESSLAGAAEEPMVIYGLQQQLSRHVLGVTLEKELTPLLHGGYTMLAAGVDDEAGETALSLLHQFNLSFSLGNESDLLLSVLLASGKGLDNAGRPRSEFGHTPPGITLRFRYYF